MKLQQKGEDLGGTPYHCCGGHVCYSFKNINFHISINGDPGYFSYTLPLLLSALSLYIFRHHMKPLPMVHMTMKYECISW